MFKNVNKIIHIIMNKVLRKLHLMGKRFATSEEIKIYCKEYGMSYYNTVRNLISAGYLVRIFRGIFYVKDFNEIKLGRLNISHLELIAKGIEIKGIKNWYYGLYTALKLNNVTHEYFSVDYVINDRIFRYKPIDIAGYKIKFVKLKGELTHFGIIEDTYRYSDLEKTILDMIYLWRYNGKPREKIIMDISDYAENISTTRLRKYLSYYPKTVKEIVEEII